MRRIFALIILFCIAYFIGGYVAVQFDLITEKQYLAYAGIVGGLASVSGLFSFIKPPLTKDDFQSLEMDSLKSLVETTEEVEALEKQRLQAKNEIGDLEERKKEMELLVKKASMSLFLKEQYSQHEHKILARIKSDDSLGESLSQISDIKSKIDLLEDEIETDPNVETLRDVIKSANRNRDSIDEAIEAMPAIVRILFLASRELSRAISATIGTIR